MLTLTRRAEEGLTIGDEIEVVVLSVSRGRVRLGIRAPRSIGVHRSELVAKVGSAVREAIVPEVEEAEASEPTESEARYIELPRGLLGMSGQTQYVISDVDAEGALWLLSSCDDSGVRLLVAEANDVAPGYPIDEAKALAAEIVPALRHEEVAVAVIIRAPREDMGATVNLAAPVVIGLASRRGAQVLLDRPQLGVSHPVSFRKTDELEEASP